MNGFGLITSPDTVRIERVLPGPIERIWAYLTESEKRSRWLAGGDMEQRSGGRVELVFRNSELTENDVPPPPKYAKLDRENRMEGRITACEPPNLLSFTWGEASEVCFELTARADEVALVVTHRRLPARDQMISVAAGWHAHLDILADHLEGRVPAGFWATHTRLEAEYDRRIPAL